MKLKLLPNWIRKVLRLKTHEGFRNELMYNIIIAFKEQQDKALLEKVLKFNNTCLKPALSNYEVKSLVKAITKPRYKYNIDFPVLKEILKENNISIK